MGIKISSIIFLGTGADAYSVGKGLRSAGGIIIQINENQFHLDPGPGSLLSAKQTGVNLRANTALLVSNTDLYYCNDINAVIDAMTYSGFDKKGVLIANKTLINGSEKEKPYITNFHKDCLERFIVLQAGQRVGVNEVEIEALKTTHKDGIGFKFFTPNFTLSYSSATKYSIEIAEQYKDSGILILNMLYPEREGNPGLNREDVIKIINRAAPRLAIITGFGNKMLEADPLYVAREIQKATGIQTIAARDGMVISPVSYSAQEGQRTFGTFREDRKAELREPEEAGTQEEKEEVEAQIEEKKRLEKKEVMEEQKTISNTIKEEEQSDSQENTQ